MDRGKTVNKEQVVNEESSCCNNIWSNLLLNFYTPFMSVLENILILFFLVSYTRLFGELSGEVTVFSKPLVYFLTNTSIFKAQETSVEKGLSGGKSLFIGTAILCKSERSL